MRDLDILERCASTLRSCRPKLTAEATWRHDNATSAGDGTDASLRLATLDGAGRVKYDGAPKISRRSLPKGTSGPPKRAAVALILRLRVPGPRIKDALARGETKSAEAAPAAAGHPAAPAADADASSPLLSRSTAHTGTHGATSTTKTHGASISMHKAPLPRSGCSKVKRSVAECEALAGLHDEYWKAGDEERLTRFFELARRLQGDGAAGISAETSSISTDSTAGAAAGAGAAASATRDAGTGRGRGAVLQMLYMKRAIRRHDPWSGNVALPGGHREAGESDYEAAVREAQEEVGLDVTQPSYVCLGRLDDRVVYARGRKVGMYMGAFVFVCTEPVYGEPGAPEAAGPTGADSLRLCPHETAGAHWVPVRRMNQLHVQREGLQHELAFIPCLRHMNTTLRKILGIASVHFPTLDLCADPLSEDATARPAVPIKAGAAPAAASAAPAEPLEYNLWGLTLSVTSDFIGTAGEAALAWPPVKLHNPILEGLLGAGCGLIELFGALVPPCLRGDSSTPRRWVDGQASRAWTGKLRKGHFRLRHVMLCVLFVGILAGIGVAAA